MNERIRLLAEQCRGNQMTSEFEPRFDREKFAELIVRECAVTAGLMEHEGRKGIGAQILDNFGVKK
jgi:hypothetical protein